MWCALGPKVKLTHLLIRTPWNVLSKKDIAFFMINYLI